MPCCVKFASLTVARYEDFIGPILFHRIMTSNNDDVYLNWEAETNWEGQIEGCGLNQLPVIHS